MNFFSRRLPAVLMGATVVMVQPQLAVALSPIQISDIAKEFTVLITGDGIGSGVIFERKGDTYFVITNQHVVSNDGRYEIQTVDGSRYPVYRSQALPGLDIAILQFTSKKNYRLAELGNSDQRYWNSIPKMLLLTPNGVIIDSCRKTFRERLLMPSKQSALIPILA